VTWIRLRLDAGVTSEAGRSDLGLVWAGLNAVRVNQRAHVAAEALPLATGEPDQVYTLSHSPLGPRSVQLTVTTRSTSQTWNEIDDLLSAGPEVPVVDPRLPPGTQPSAPPAPDRVFAVNLESGELRFGDGLRGRRPPFNAILQVDYYYSMGREGNVGPHAINAGPALPAGFRVDNPLRTWGGTDSESVAEGEKQISRYLQHRERLVTIEDW